MYKHQAIVTSTCDYTSRKYVQVEALKCRQKKSISYILYQASIDIAVQQIIIGVSSSPFATSENPIQNSTPLAKPDGSLILWREKSPFRKPYAVNFI